jgi:transposase
MPEIATIGFDIAKNVFQLHGVDRSGKIILHKALCRSQVQGFFSTLPGTVISGRSLPARVLLNVAASGRGSHIYGL